MIESVIVLALVVVFRTVAVEYADTYKVLKSLILPLNIGIAVAVAVVVAFIGITIAAAIRRIGNNRR